MNNNTVRIRLQYNNKTTSVEMDTPRSIEPIRTFLRALWEAMGEQPIRLIPSNECKVELCNMEQNKSSKPVEVHYHVCPKCLNSKDNCTSYCDGECLFYRAAINDDTKRLCVYQPEPEANS